LSERTRPPLRVISLPTPSKIAYAIRCSLVIYKPLRRKSCRDGGKIIYIHIYIYIRYTYKIHKENEPENDDGLISIWDLDIRPPILLVALPVLPTSECHARLNLATADADPTARVSRAKVVYAYALHIIYIRSRCRWVAQSYFASGVWRIYGSDRSYRRKRRARSGSSKRSTVAESFISFARPPSHSPYVRAHVRNIRAFRSTLHDSNPLRRIFVPTRSGVFAGCYNTYIHSYISRCTACEGFERPINFPVRSLSGQRPRSSSRIKHAPSIIFSRWPDADRHSRVVFIAPHLDRGRGTDGRAYDSYFVILIACRI